MLGKAPQGQILSSKRSSPLVSEAPGVKSLKNNFIPLLYPNAKLHTPLHPSNWPDDRFGGFDQLYLSSSDAPIYEYRDFW